MNILSIKEQEYQMDKILKICVALVIVVIIGCLAVFAGSILHPAEDTAITAGNPVVYFFYGEECSHCHVVMPFILNLTKKYPDVNFQILETWHNQTNQEIYVEMNNKAGISAPGVPEVIIGKTVLVGERDIPDKLEGLILEQLKKK
ncbi:MAG: thioredoxin family protein [Methanoregula sp.]|jgi:thiol-disulfide isomerase/thioredoxin